MLIRVLVLGNLFWLSACVDTGYRLNVQSANQASQGEDVVEKEPDDPPPPIEPVPELKLCSSLNLSGIEWPKTLVTNEIRALAIGLNITGSFEGRSGFQTITNNFDGQGMSLGLFQQNLGQGSLQPLLLKYYDRYRQQFEDAISEPHRTYVLEMLKAWNDGDLKPSGLLSTQSTSGVQVLSPLDDPELRQAQSGVEALGAASSRRNEDSVTWAKKNLFNSKGAFYSTWKTQWQTLAGSEGYRTLQIEKSLALHAEAESYVLDLKFTDLRAYLFFLDIVVQNGGLYNDDISDYHDYLKSNPNATQTQRLKKILSLRLRWVRAAYREDVNARKTALIDGFGTVHGSRRNLPKEYCYNNSDSYE